jgi:PKD repeat protein
MKTFYLPIQKKILSVLILLFITLFVSLNSYAQPVISGVSVTAGDYKVGDAITVIITADNYGYTESAITINGSAVSGFTDNGDNTYTVTYTVAEGNTDRTSVGDIPISVELDNLGSINTPYTTPPTSGGSVTIDANTPVISNVVSDAGAGGVKKIGDIITFTIDVQGPDPFLAFLPTNYNGQAITYITADGGNTYTATYTVTEGDADQAIPLQLTGVTATDAAGNVSLSLDGTDVTATIDANSPVIADVSIPSGTYVVGDNIDVTITASEVGLVANSIWVNGVLLAGLTDNADNTYSITYIIAAGDADHASISTIPISVTLDDAAGNSSVAYTSSLSGGPASIDANSLVISDVTSTDIICNGDNNGSIDITATGSGTLEYSIDGGTSWQLPSSFYTLLAGDYTIWVRDDADTTIFISNPVTIVEPEEVTHSVNISDVTTIGGSDGWIEVHASGGDYNFEITNDGGSSWIPASSPYTFSELPAGNYDIQVRDGNGCVSTTTNETINEPSGPIVYFPFDGDVLDASGNGYDGTPINLSPAEDRFYAPSAAYDFTDTAARVEVGNNLNLINGSVPFTIAAWLKSNEYSWTGSGQQYTIAAERDGGDNWQFAVLENSLYFSYWDGGIEYPFQGNAYDMQVGPWQYVVVTYDGNNIRFYINENSNDANINEKYNWDVGTINIDNNPSNLYVGSLYPGIEDFRGSIDEVEIYDRALSHQEIQDKFWASGYNPYRDVTFHVNMNYQIVNGFFDPESESVQVAGWWNDFWGDEMFDNDGDGVYEYVWKNVVIGLYQQFKFRTNWNWDGIHDFPGGGPNREITVIDGENIYEAYINDESLNDDIGIVSLQNPFSSCEMTGSQSVEVDIKNFGLNTITNLDISYNFEYGGYIIPENATPVLAPNDIYTHYFATDVDIPDYGEFNLDVAVSLAGDEVSWNDTMSYTITNKPSINTFPYVENFDAGSHYWTAGGLNSSWEIGTPAGYVINSAASGSNAWVTNLAGEWNQNEKSYVESPCFDFTSITNPVIRLKIWRRTVDRSAAALQYSIDGVTWEHVGINWSEMNKNWYAFDNSYIDFSGNTQAWMGYDEDWVVAQEMLSDLAGESVVRFRIVFGSEDSSPPAYDGFGFDDIEIFDLPVTDAIAYSLSNIGSECNLPSDRNLDVEIKNMGSGDISNFNVYYQIDGNAPVSELFSGTLMQFETTTFTFSTQADFSTPEQIYAVKAWTDLAGDEDFTNDTVFKTVTHRPVINSYPYIENFEAASYWEAYGTNDYTTWEIGAPAGPIINSAASGSNVLATNLDGMGGFREQSIVEAPCFDFSSLANPIIEFKLWRDFMDWDHGLVLQYSVNHESWQTVGATGDQYNWYTQYPNDGQMNFINWSNSVEGWNTTTDNDWVTVRHTLDGLGSEADVRLRFAYNSPDNWEQNEGVAIDDIQIYDAPAVDLFAAKIENPQSGADLTPGEQVTVAIVNNGASATSGDYAIHLYIDNLIEIDDTINTVINPGDTLHYDFSALADFSDYKTYDVKVSVAIPGDGFILNDTVYTKISNSPLISAFPYLQDFEGTQYWSVYGDDPSWELGFPAGPSITYAASGDNAWVTRLDGDANTDEVSFVESPYFDFTALTDPAIKFYIWSEGAWNTGVSLQFTTDNGENWYTVGDVGTGLNWYNNNVDALNFLNSNAGWSDNITPWTLVKHTLDGLGGLNNVKLRFVFTSWTEPDNFGFDDMIIFDNNQEASVRTINSPTSGCNLSSTETIEVNIRNFGSGAISNFDVSYQIDTETPVTETYTESIDPGNTATFPFITTVDLSGLGTYDIKVWTDVPGDGDRSNDTIYNTISSNPVVNSFPYEQDFEGVHYWTAAGQNSSWEWGEPVGTVINSANSGANAWVTNVNGGFNPDEQSWVEGPCFDFSSLTSPIVQISYWRYTRHDAGAAIQYSTDGGVTWNQLGNHWDTPFWYEDDIGALDFSGSWAGWAGWSNDWVNTSHEISWLAGEPEVRFRVAFGSQNDADNSLDGFAFDDIKIYDQPEQSASITHINSPRSCQLDDGFGFELFNNGLNPIDSVEAFYQIDGGEIVSQMFFEYVDPYNSWGGDFEVQPDFSAEGTYNVKMWISVNGDNIQEDDTLYKTLIHKPVINSFPYNEDFEGGAGDWTSTSIDHQYLNDSWKLGPPSGTAINSAASGSNAWSTTPAVLNSNEKSGIESSCFDFSGLITPAIQFNMWRELIDNEHGVALQYSTDGNTWITIGNVDDTTNWYTAHPNDPNFMHHFGSSNDSWNSSSDGGWVTANHNLDDLGGLSNVKLRFVYATYNVFDQADGFALDDIQIYENAFPNDAAAVDIIGEQSLPYRTATEDIIFVFKNNGTNEITSIDVAYQVNGGTIYSENVTASILIGEEYTYTFTQTADLSAVGEYNIKLWTSLTGDQLTDNDTLEIVAVTTPIISSFPYEENFESGHGDWYAGGQNYSWEVGIPAQVNTEMEINSATSGSKIWATNLEGTFNDYEDSYVVSPGFDLSGIIMPFIELQKWSSSEDWCSGVAILYSVDTGATWQAVGAAYEDTNWYNIENSWTVHNIIPWPRHCWSGYDGGWIKASHNIIDAGGKPLVMFKVAFGADNFGHFEGFAFDDIRIYEGAPEFNASLLNLATNAPECYPTNAEEITVDIVNRGVNPISDFNLSLSINNDGIAYEYIGDVINPGDTLHYVFAQLVDLTGTDYQYKVKIDAGIDYPSDGFEDDNYQTIEPWFFSDFTDPWHWESYKTCNSDIHGNKFYDIVQGPDGDMWMTNQQGVSRFDGSTWIHYSDTNQLVNNYTWNLFKDNAGNIWLPSTSNDTITQYDGASFIFHPVPGQFEECAFQDSSGNVWFGSYDGIGVLMYDGIDFTQYDHSVGIPGTQIWSIAHDLDGDLLVASDQGVVQYNGVDWTEFQLNGMSGKLVTEIFNDKQGNIWFANYLDNMIMRYDGTTWEEIVDVEGYSARVLSIDQDSAGNVWFGAQGYILKYNSGVWSVEAQEYGLGGWVYGMGAAVDGSMWFGTSYRGVLKYKYDPNPNLAVSESTWAFNSVPVGGNEYSNVFWVTNGGGDDPLVITNTTLTGTDFVTDFDEAGFTGLQGDTIYFSFEFVPSLVGEINETFTIESNGGTVVIDLHGVGHDCALAEEAIKGLNYVPGVPYWHVYTPAEDEIITITSCVVENSAAQPDTKLYVYESCDADLNNDESPDNVAYSWIMDYCEFCENNWQSTVRFYAFAGVEYKIYWDPQWDQQPFYFDLSTEVPIPGDMCENAIDISPNVKGETGSTETFINDYQKIGDNTSFIFGNDVVYRINISEPGIISGSISGSYATMFITNGCPVEDASVLGYAGGEFGGTIENTTIYPGDYYVVVSSWDPTEFTAYTLDLNYSVVSPGDLVLNVNMNYQLQEGNFIKGTDVLDVVGSFNGYVGTPLTDVEGNGIYTVVIAGNTIGEVVDYKLRISSVEETIPQRSYEILDDVNYVTHWYNDEYPYEAYTSVWYEDFNQGAGTDSLWLPAGWSVADSTYNDYVFRWANHGPRGRYNGLSGAAEAFTPNEEHKLQSTTTDNGFLMLEADLYNTGENGELAPGYVGMNSFVQTPSIDLSGYENIILRFEQHFRYCCSGSNRLSVFISVDFDIETPTSAHWVEFDTKSSYPANLYSQNPDVVELDISQIAGDKSNVTIRWHMIDASHYFWAIDDVELLVPPQNDLAILETHIELLNEEFSYSMIPKSQAKDMQFSAIVLNKGTMQQNNAFLQVDLDIDANILFSNASDKMNIGSLAEEKLFVDNLYNPIEVGVHNVNYFLTQNQMDQNPADNNEVLSFNVTESVYARDNSVLQNQSSLSPSSYVNGVYDGNFLSTKYRIYREAEVNSISTVLSSRALDISKVESGETRLVGHVFRWDDFNNIMIEEPVASTDTFVVSITDTMQWVTIPIIKDGDSEYLLPGQYFAGFEIFSNTFTEQEPGYSTISFVINEEPSIVEDITALRIQGNWYFEDRVPFIRLNLGASQSATVYVNVDMNYQIDQLNFDPLVDTVKLWTAQNEWTVPYIMKDNDEDGIYSYTLNDVAFGKVFNYEFGINESIESEFSAVETSREIYINNLYVEINKIYNNEIPTANCFANFEYDINNFEVSFFDNSLGDIAQYSWSFGDGNFSELQNPVHEYAEADFYEVCLTIYDDVNNCVNDYCDVISIVDSNVVTCNADFTYEVWDDTAYFSSISQGAITNYLWDFGDGTYGYEADIEHEYFEPGYYDVCLTIYDENSDCLDDYCDVVIIEDEIIALCKSDFTTFVDSNNVVFTSSSEGNITDYMWNFGDGTYAYTKDATHDYDEPGYYDVCLSVFDEEGNCFDESCKTIPVIFLEQAVCNSSFEYFSQEDSVWFNSVTQGNITNYMWDFGDGGYAYVADTVHKYKEPGYYEVCLTVYDDESGCLDDFCKVVIVDFQDQAICKADFEHYSNQDTVRFNGKVQGNITDYFWDFGDGKYAYTEDAIHIYDEPGYYDVCFTAYDEIGDCMDTYCKIVVVAFQDQVICNADYSYYSNEDTVRFNGIVQGDITDYFWDFGDGTYAYKEDTMHIYDEPGYYDVCFTVYDDDGDCMDTYCKVIVVTFEDQAICNANFGYYTNEDTVRFNGKVQGNITDYFWDFGDGKYAYKEDTMHIYKEPGYYEVCFTVYDETSDCLDEFCDVVVVSFENQAVCNADYSYYSNEDTVRFNGITQGNITDYFWDFGDGKYAYTKKATHIYEEPGYYGVCFTVYDEDGDCMDEQCKMVVVTFENQAICNASYEYYTKEDTVRFNGKVQGDITDYFWDFGDGKYAYKEDTMHIYEEPGYYEVCFTAYDEINNCMDEFCDIVVVSFENQAICNANFEFYTKEDTVRFNGKIQGNITDHFWDFGDGYYAYTEDAMHIYEEPGYYEVNYTVYDDASECLDEIQKVVVVSFENRAICKSAFEYYSLEDTVQFNNLSQGDITDYFWDFGDGNYAYTKKTTHIYEESGYYEVCLTVYDDQSDCLDETCDMVVVTFENQAICKADYEFYSYEDTVKFTNLSQGNITDYMWDFGDGYYAYTKKATHIYAKPGYYEVRLTVYDDDSGCLDEYVDVVIVTFENEPVCNAKYEYYTEGNTVVFENQSIGEVTDHFWDFGNGTYSYDVSPTRTFAKPGYYEVCLTIYNDITDCMDEFCKVVVVSFDNQAICNAKYEYYTEGLNVSFKDKSEGKITDYFWDFDDGTYSYVDDVVHPYNEPGYYEVCLTIYNDTSDCMDEKCKVVVVVDPENEICNANFEVFTEGYNATFTSEAIGAYENIFWDFDDGTNSNQESPVHTYAEPGYYEVAFTVIDTATDCFDTRTKVVFIEGAAEIVPCYASFSFYPDNDSYAVTFTDESYGDPVSWYWDFGDNTEAVTDQNPVHTYTQNNYYRVCLTIENASGSQDTYCKIIAVGDVSDASFAYFTYFADSITSTGHFRNESRGNIVSYNWDFGDGYGSDQEHPSHSYETTGYYAVCLTTMSATNEEKTFCNDVRIGNSIENPCLFSCVWPGDANNNLEANHYDIMTIGLNFNKTGPKRDSVSIYPIGHYGQDWSTYQADGTNNKHADCNGDGVVNFDDTLAVDQNFAWSHYYTPSRKNNAYEIIVEWDTSYNETKATAGKARARMARPTKVKEDADMYAIGYEIEVVGGEGLLFNSITVNFDGNWLGTYGEDLLGFYALDSTKQMIYVGMSRTDQTNTSGGGHLIDIYFYYKDGYDESGISFIATSLGGIDASGLGINIGGSFSIDLGNDIEACKGDTVILDAGEGYAGYVWSNTGSTTNLLEVTQSGKYFVTVTDSTGASSIDSILVEVHELPVVNLGTDIESNEPVTLDAGAGFDAYLWQDASIAQTYLVTETGEYWVQVTDANGCQNADTINVQVGVGVSEVNTFGSRMLVYPNPASGYFMLIIESKLTEDVNVELYNLQGQKAYVKEFRNVERFNQKIDVSKLNNGVYYLKVSKGTDYAIMKVILQ